MKIYEMSNIPLKVPFRLNHRNNRRLCAIKQKFLGQYYKINGYTTILVFESIKQYHFGSQLKQKLKLVLEL